MRLYYNILYILILIWRHYRVHVEYYYMRLVVTRTQKSSRMITQYEVVWSIIYIFGMRDQRMT